MNCCECDLPGKESVKPETIVQQKTLEEFPPNELEPEEPEEAGARPEESEVEREDSDVLCLPSTLQLDRLISGEESEIFAQSSMNMAVALGYARPLQDRSDSKSDVVMSLRLEDHRLLRGTNIVHVLRRLGTELRVNSLNKDFSPQEATNLYGRSDEVKEIDYFISHCWQDERFAKTVALLIHSNLLIAMLLASLVALTMCILSRLALLPILVPDEEDANPYFPWALCSGMLTFFLVLSTWHYVRACFVASIQRVGWRITTKNYFLDKFCVHQRNDRLKKAGVRSFAAFVASSKNLLLLWSPQYFTRLWCTLELAALVKSKSHLRTLPLTIMPLQLAKVSLISWICSFLVYMMYQFNKVIGSPVPDVPILVVALFLGGFCWSFALRKYARDRIAMNEQILSFSVQSAKCSDPRDRMWVEKTMLRWFADLDSCNEHIRHGLREQVIAALGPESHYPTSLVLPILLVNLFSEADYVASGFYDEKTLRRSMGAIGLAAGVVTLLPALFRLALHFSTRHDWRIEVLINLFLGVATTVIAFTAFVLSFFVVQNENLGVWVVAVVPLQILFAVWLQRGSCNSFRYSWASNEGSPRKT